MKSIEYSYLYNLLFGAFPEEIFWGIEKTPVRAN